MPQKLLKKPVEVEGVQWNGDNLDELKQFVGDALIENEDGSLKIKTMEGDHDVVHGATVIQGVKGEFYPVDPAVFDETFFVLDGATGTPSMEAKLTAAQRKNLKPSQYAVPGKEELPIHDAGHVKAAWRMLPLAKGLSAEEKAKARKRILSAAKAFGIDTANWASNESFKDEAAEGEPVEDNASIGVEDSAGPGQDETPEWPATDVIPYLLNQVAEEASETGQAACKSVRFGLSSIDPKNGKSGRDKLREEVNDVLGAIKIVNEELESRGIAPIDGIGDETLVQASIDKRKTNLQKEYEDGRFTLPDSTDEG